MNSWGQCTAVERDPRRSAALGSSPKRECLFGHSSRTSKTAPPLTSSLSGFRGSPESRLRRCLSSQPRASNCRCLHEDSLPKPSNVLPRFSGQSGHDYGDWSYRRRQRWLSTNAVERTTPMCGHGQPESDSKQPKPAWCSHVRSPARGAPGLEQTPQSYRSSSASGTKNLQPREQSG